MIYNKKKLLGGTMGLFGRIFRATTGIALAPLVAPIAVAAVAVAATVGGAVYIRNHQHQNNSQQMVQSSDGDSLPSDQDWCRQHPNLRNCRAMAAQADGSGQMAQQEAAYPSAERPRPPCHVETYVQEVRDQADKTYTELSRVSSTVNSLPNAGRTSAITQNRQCQQELQDARKQYENIPQNASNACRNNYNVESESLVRNQNLLAAYFNVLTTNSNCSGALAAVNGTPDITVAASAPVQTNGGNTRRRMIADCDDNSDNCSTSAGNAIR